MMNPSRSSLAAKVKALDPSRFQSLTEEYATIKFPDRFKHLQRRGSNITGEAIAGWPDAYAIAPDGRLDILEVTHARAWRDHLRQDIGKASAAPLYNRICGFAFVAWARTPDPTVRLNFHDKLLALGIPSEHIALIFREQLVSDLCEARFALLWEKYLNLPAPVLPFYPIDQATIYGSIHRLEVFTPAREEYTQGLVYRPLLTTKVEETLLRDGWALVRGKGASGKTIMAAQIAKGAGFRAAPVYYLDLEELISADEAIRFRVLDVITWRKDEGVLFIVDNIHLNEQMAREIFDYWNESRDGSYLLLLGRWTEAGLNPRGIADSFEGIDEKALTLEVTEEDLLGVLRRLSARLSPTHQIRNPPAAVVTRWLALFGGDLIAYSAAVALRISQIALGDWEITAKDAREYVRSRYLYPADPLTDDELRNLLMIAALSKLEFGVPSAAIKWGDLRKSLGNGIVHRVETTRGDIVHFRLVHPGLGELLLSAADPPIDERSLHREFALRVPSDAILLSAYLEEREKKTPRLLLLACHVKTPPG